MLQVKAINDFLIKTLRGWSSCFCIIYFFLWNVKEECLICFVHTMKITLTFHWVIFQNIRRIFHRRNNGGHEFEYKLTKLYIVLIIFVNRSHALISSWPLYVSLSTTPPTFVFNINNYFSGIQIILQSKGRRFSVLWGGNGLTIGINYTWNNPRFLKSFFYVNISIVVVVFLTLHSIQRGWCWS